MDHYTGSHVHNHGLLAGLGAGAAAVLGCFLLVLGVWHRVSSAVGTAVTVLVWALVAVCLVAAAFAVAYLGLRLRRHVTHPETLTRQSVRAEVIPASPPLLPAPQPVAELPAPQHITHNHFDSAGAVQAALAAMRGEDEQ